MGHERWVVLAELPARIPDSTQKKRQVSWVSRGHHPDLHPWTDPVVSYTSNRNRTEIEQISSMPPDFIDKKSNFILQNMRAAGVPVPVS